MADVARIRHAAIDAGRLALALAATPASRRAVQALGDEARRPLPGDDVVAGAREQWTNGVTIHAGPEEIWPWLVQMGCTRGGWYSYDGLDNGGAPSAAAIVPELQHVAVGDVLPWTPSSREGFVVCVLEPGRALVLAGTPPPYRMSWALVLEPVDDDTTRLIARCRGVGKGAVMRTVLPLVLRPLHFAMQRRQLLTIKERAEGAARTKASWQASERTALGLAGRNANGRSPHAVRPPRRSTRYGRRV
jgi:proline iminopeptidase